MSPTLKSVLEKHKSLIEQEKYEELICKVEKIFAASFKADEYNEFIKFLEDCGVFEAEESLNKYARGHTTLDDEELENLIEEDLSSPYRCKYLGLSEYQDCFKFEWCSQERMDQDATNMMAVLVNQFLIEYVSYAEGMPVHGVTYCRDTPKTTYEFHFVISSNMKKYELKYKYHVVFSNYGEEYIWPEETFAIFDNADDAEDKMQELAWSDEIIEEYADGNIVILKIPEGTTPEDFDKYYYAHEYIG